MLSSPAFAGIVENLTLNELDQNFSQTSDEWVRVDIRTVDGSPGELLYINNQNQKHVIEVRFLTAVGFEIKG